MPSSVPAEARDVGALQVSGWRGPCPDPMRWSPTGDKSISQRALLLASLATGRSVVQGLLWSEDTMHCLTALRQLGVRIDADPAGRAVIDGVGRHGLGPARSPVYLGNSATSARIMLALLAGQRHGSVLDGNECLRGRPMEWVVGPLREMGADIEYLGAPGRLPVTVRPVDHLVGKEVEVRVASAQAVSALLFGGVVAEGKTTIRRVVRARDHTERMLRHFGVSVEERADRVVIEPPATIEARRVPVAGDISAAALVIAAVVLHSCSGLAVTIESVGLNPTRTGFLEVLRAMNADIRITPTGTTSGEPVGDVTVVAGRRLHGVRVEGPELVQRLIDEVPLLAAVAATADGPTEIADAAELRDKDTDRIAMTAALLRSFGVRVETTSDGLTIEPNPGGELHGPGWVTAAGDHRIAFAAMALASRLDQPTVIGGWEVVEISFPSCLAPLRRLASVQVLARVPTPLAAFTDWRVHPDLAGPGTITTKEGDSPCASSG